MKKRSSMRPTWSIAVRRIMVNAPFSTSTTRVLSCAKSAMPIPPNAGILRNGVLSSASARQKEIHTLGARMQDLCKEPSGLYVFGPTTPTFGFFSR